MHNIPIDQRDGDLVNIYSTQYTFERLPELFSWKDTQERHEWTRALTDTFRTLNDEILDHDYSDPNEINRGNPQDVFRFTYLMDMLGGERF